MEFKKKDLNELCFNLLNQELNTETKALTFKGLTTEQMTLGLKRRLEKIRTTALKHLQEFQQDMNELQEAICVKAAAKLPEGAKREDYDKADKDSEKGKFWIGLLEGFSEELIKEVEELGNETVKIDCEPVSLAMLEKIETKALYNWEMLEKIAV